MSEIIEAERVEVKVDPPPPLEIWELWFLNRDDRWMFRSDWKTLEEVQKAHKPGDLIFHLTNKPDPLADAEKKYRETLVKWYEYTADSDNDSIVLEIEDGLENDVIAAKAALDALKGEK
jgi:hypothetical protein